MGVRKKFLCLNFLVSLVLIFLNDVKCQERSVKCDLNTNYLCADDKSCIPKKYVCNGYTDCPTKDDEKDCDIEKCSDRERFFMCRDQKTCVGRSVICDNEADCPDASDESDELCDQLASSISTYSVITNLSCNPLTEFHCGNNVCIPVDDICNGANNCIDGSDEDIKMCRGIRDVHHCPGYLCKNEKCLERHEFVCDGFDDCGDGSDEEHCSVACELKDGKFLCASGDQCINLEQVCDNNTDCTDKSDEGERCKHKDINEKEECDKMNCREGSKCKVLPSGPICYCINGYQKNAKTSQCEDINECEKFGVCSQGCVNQKGSYYCTCAKGFILNADKKSCDTTSVNASLIYTTKNNIKQIIFGQRNIFYHKRVANTKQSVGVAYDGESYYWTEVDMAREVIVKFNPSTNVKEILLTNGLELPEYIAVDWLTKNIYFTDSTRQHVAVCTNDGYYCTELLKIDIMHFPRAIALHPTEALLFWSDWGNHSHIGVSLMDGSDAKVLVDDVSWPNGLALDWPNGRIYWVDALSNAIESVTITGKDRRIILEGVFKHPFSLDVFGNTLYWSDHGTKSIEHCNKFTGKDHDVLVQGEDVFDVHIYDSSAMPYAKHGCENNPCSHICLLSRNGTYSCACPVGMELNNDNHNCRFNSKSFIIHIGIGTKLYSKTFQAFGRSVDNAVKHTEVAIQKIEFNVLNGAIFYANNFEHKLYVLDAIGNSHLLLHDSNLHITSMSFDYLGNNLYWADNLRETIEVFSLTTKKRAIVHHYTGDHVPVSIVVVPTLGEIFVALVSQKDSQINRVSMKGSSMDETNFQFIRDGLGRGGRILLAVDENAKKIYWSDAKKKRIEFANLDGTERKIFIQSERVPGPMTIVDNYLHWTSEDSKSLQWRKNDGTGPVKLTRLEGIEGSKSKFPQVFPLTTGRPIKINSNPCAVNNGGCSDICISDGISSKVCLCAIGRVFLDKSQMNCVERSHCDFRCGSGECIESKMLCDGKIDCVDRSDEDTTKCKKLKCKSNQFACDDGECISKSLRCDKNKNCKDGSDEFNCPKNGTLQICGSPHQLVCQHSDVCIYRTQICDMNPDCPDGSDEFEDACNHPCNGNEFKCLSGQCVPKEFECNHKIDCYDGSDEHENCSHMCKAPFKPCRDGHCIHERFFCDGVDDCEDKFDELNCSNTTNTSSVICPDNSFQCPSNPSICLPEYKKCDKSLDCPKGEDERGCLKCKPYEFPCTNGHCIDGYLKCDGKSDCSDHSDEEDCKDIPPPTTCTASNFKCSNGKCLDYKRVCDNVHDCDDDEGGQCNVTCAASKCNQNCHKSPKGLVCSCKPGYELKAGSSTNCTDINECKSVTSSPCSQLCVNTEGSYKCFCHDEYVLDRDGHECKATGDPYKLIYALNTEIRVIDPSKRDLLFDTSYPISDMAVDVRKNMLMYSLVGESGLYVLNMTTKTVDIIEEFPAGIIFSYDWITENIYMTARNSFNKLAIYACSMNSKKCVQIYKLSQSRDHIVSMDIDPVHNYLFFVKRTSSYTSKIKTEIVRLKLDGSHEKSMFQSADYNFIRAISVDSRSRTIYFTEQRTQSLQKINYQGEGRATFVHQSGKLMTPSALANFENHAYILDESHGKIIVCKLYQDNECGNEFNVATTRRFIISHISKQIDGENKCKNHKCPEICVIADFDKKCMCSNEKGQGVMCDELEHTDLNHLNKPDEGSGMAVWILLLFALLLIVGGSALFIYYRQKGFNYDMNINFHKKGMKIDDIGPEDMNGAGPSLKDRLNEKPRTVTPFPLLENQNENVQKTNNSDPQQLYPSNQFENFGMFSDIEENGVINSDDDDGDQQRLIR